MFWFGSVFALLVLIPAVRLLRRAGRSGWLALLLLVPLVNVMFVWWLAFSRSARGAGEPNARGRCGGGSGGGGGGGKRRSEQEVLT